MAMTSDQMFCLQHCVDERPDADHHQLHIHDHYEIYALVAGDVDYMVEGRIYTVRPGSLLIMRQGETHKTVLKSEERYDRYILFVRPELMRRAGFPEELFAPFHERGLGQRNLYVPAEFPDVQPLTYFKKMFYEKEFLPEDEVIEANLRAMLCGVNAAFRKNPVSPEREQKKNLGRDVIEYINEHLTSELSLEQISREFHMSPSQISRVFRRLTGTSVYNYILSKRLMLAQARIVAGEGAVVASQESGFWDYSSFYRLYKKRFGVPPSEHGDRKK